MNSRLPFALSASLLVAACSAHPPKSIFVPTLSTAPRGLYHTTALMGGMQLIGPFLNTQTKSVDESGTRCEIGLLAHSIVVKCVAREPASRVHATSDARDIQNGDYIALAFTQKFKDKAGQPFIFFVNPKNARSLLRPDMSRPEPKWGTSVAHTDASWSATYSIPFSALRSRGLSGERWFVGLLRFDTFNGTGWYWPRLSNSSMFSIANETRLRVSH